MQLALTSLQKEKSGSSTASLQQELEASRKLVAKLQKELSAEDERKRREEEADRVSYETAKRKQTLIASPLKQHIHALEMTSANKGQRAYRNAPAFALNVPSDFLEKGFAGGKREREESINEEDEGAGMRMRRGVKSSRTSDVFGGSFGDDSDDEEEVQQTWISLDTAGNKENQRR